MLFDEAIEADKERPTFFLTDTSLSHNPNNCYIVPPPSTDQLPQDKNFNYSSFPVLNPGLNHFSPPPQLIYIKSVHKLLEYKL